MLVSQTIPEQLCDISRGVHLKFSQAAPPATSAANFNGGLALLQFLLFWILPSVALRPAIAALSVHHRRSNMAVCFCHHKPVEVCCICSCCLASESRVVSEEAIRLGVGGSRVASKIARALLLGWTSCKCTYCLIEAADDCARWWCIASWTGSEKRQFAATAYRNTSRTHAHTAA